MQAGGGSVPNRSGDCLVCRWLIPLVGWLLFFSFVFSVLRGWAAKTRAKGCDEDAIGGILVISLTLWRFLGL